MRSASAMNARPLRASRHAAVAIAQMLPYVQNVAQGAKAPQRIECRIDGIDGQQSGRLHLTPKAREHFLVEDGRGLSE